jgi:transposase
MSFVWNTFSKAWCASTWSLKELAAALNSSSSTVCKWVERERKGGMGTDGRRRER